MAPETFLNTAQESIPPGWESIPRLYKRRAQCTSRNSTETGTTAYTMHCKLIYTHLNLIVEKSFFDYLNRRACCIPVLILPMFCPEQGYKIMMCSSYKLSHLRSFSPKSCLLGSTFRWHIFRRSKLVVPPLPPPMHLAHESKTEKEKM